MSGARWESALVGIGLVLFFGGAAIGLMPATAPCAAGGPTVDMRDLQSVAALAEAVVRNPRDLDCTLSRAGHSRASFVALIDDVHSDRALASAYRSARADAALLHTR